MGRGGRTRGRLTFLLKHLGSRAPWSLPPLHLSPAATTRTTTSSSWSRVTSLGGATTGTGTARCPIVMQVSLVL